jgi:tetratricopeptide (TPR) repeat protein
MRRSLTILLLLFVISQNYCVAQFKKQLDSLSIIYNHAVSDSDKVVALGKLVDLYYTYQLNRQGDSVLREQLQVAELSDNNNLILQALFSEGITNISGYATAGTFDKTIAFVQKGIDYAKAQGQYNYIALGYIRLANLLRKRGQNDKALYEATQALQILPNVISDSIKAIIYMELGNTYVARGEAVSAVRNFNNAFDIALKLKSVPLQNNFYHSLADMYYVFLKNEDIAKDLLKKSLRLDKENNYLEGQIKDYYDLARVTDERVYLQMSIALSDSLHYNKNILQAKDLMFSFYFVIDKDSDKALQYLESEPELKASIMNAGMGNYYQRLGHVYYYSNNFDSALVYYKLAEYDFINNFDEKRSRALFQSIASTYYNLNDLPNATAYYYRALALSKRTNDIKNIATTAGYLSNLYQQQGEYKDAYEYAMLSKKYTDSLDKLSKGRDIALLDIEREDRRHADELRQLAQKQSSKRDAQYMLITISLLIVFVGMLVIGMFPISKLAIKILGYIFFISLFEFIVLVIDTFLHRITHGEPLKIWLIKIVLIAMLVPLQHFLEHRLIQFLASRKLLEARTKISFKNISLKRFLNNIKKQAPGTKEVDIEEGTAVL